MNISYSKEWQGNVILNTLRWRKTRRSPRSKLRKLLKSPKYRRKRAEHGQRLTTKCPSKFLICATSQFTTSNLRREQTKPPKLLIEELQTWSSLLLTLNPSKSFFTSHFSARTRTCHTYTCPSRLILAELAECQETSLLQSSCTTQIASWLARLMK